MLSKLLAERKKKEEMKDRAARKRTVKQTEKPFGTCGEGKVALKCQYNSTWHGHRLTTYCCFLPCGLDNTYAFSALLITKDTHTTIIQWWRHQWLHIVYNIPWQTLLTIIFYLLFLLVFFPSFSSYLWIHLSLLSLRRYVFWIQLVITWLLMNEFGSNLICIQLSTWPVSTPSFIEIGPHFGPFFVLNV